MVLLRNWYMHIQYNYFDPFTLHSPKITLPLIPLLICEKFLNQLFIALEITKI